MSDTFLPGNGFDTYESQDKVLIQMADTAACAVAVRILQQQGFAVAGAAVRLRPTRFGQRPAAPQPRPRRSPAAAKCAPQRRNLRCRPC